MQRVLFHQHLQVSRHFLDVESQEGESNGESAWKAVLSQWPQICTSSSRPTDLHFGVPCKSLILRGKTAGLVGGGRKAEVTGLCLTSCLQKGTAPYDGLIACKRRVIARGLAWPSKSLEGCLQTSMHDA